MLGSYRFYRFGIVALVLLACSGVLRAENLVVVGSGNPEYVLGQLAAAFNAQQKAHQVSVPTSIGTAGALREVENGNFPLGRVGRPLKEKESARGLVYVPIGRDAVVFVAGAAVTVRNLTRAQVIDIYTGKINNWRDVGGKPAPIRAVARETGDTSRSAIGKVIKEFKDINFDPNIKLAHLDPHMIAMLDRYPTSIGFLNRTALYAAKTKVIPLALDAHEPTPENLRSGQYPIWLEFGFVHKRGVALTGAAKAFADFVASPAGTALLRSHGVDPVAAGS